MAEPSQALVIDALSRAVADPDGVPLFAAKARPGLFASSASARKAARQCKDHGYLRTLRTESRGKSQIEICAITDKGLAFLLEHLDPRTVLETMARALEARQAELAELLTRARRTQVCLEALKVSVEKALAEIAQGRRPTALCLPETRNGHGHATDAWQAETLQYLRRRHDAGTLEDCPLPDLYRQARQTAPALSIGQFHDALRDLHARERIYLHPWTGPLYQVPEPHMSLLVGHEIAYYASLRKP